MDKLDSNSNLLRQPTHSHANAQTNSTIAIRHSSSRFGSLDCWCSIEASAIVDGLERVQSNRDHSLSTLVKKKNRIQSNPTQSKYRINSISNHDTQHRSDQNKLTIEEELQEEWRQAYEDSLLARASCCEWFRSNRKWSHSSRPRSQLESVRVSLPPSFSFVHSNLFSTTPTPILPEQHFAAVALDLMKMTYKQQQQQMSITTPEVHHALQLTIKQMSDRVPLGLLRSPLNEESLLRAERRHTFLLLLDEIERRRDEFGLTIPTSSRHLHQLRRSYFASIIQRAFRYYRARREGRKHRLILSNERRRAEEQAQAEHLLECVRVLQSSIRTRIAQHQFKQEMIREKAMKVASRRILHWYRWRSQIRRWNYEWAKTANHQSLLHQQLTKQQISCIILIQSVIRSVLCRRGSLLRFKRAMRSHRIRRSNHREWKFVQSQRGLDINQTTQSIRDQDNRNQMEIERSIVLSELYSFKEMQHALKEEENERIRLAHKFSHWESSVNNYFYKKRQLPKHWLPQSDRHSGRTYWFNLKSGSISETHPFKPAVDELKKRERQEADRLLSTRIAAIRQYVEEISTNLLAHRSVSIQKLQANAIH